jgi:hypothetical protein
MVNWLIVLGITGLTVLARPLGMLLGRHVFAGMDDILIVRAKSGQEFRLRREELTPENIRRIADQVKRSASGGSQA